jgi:hypothetical protein
LFEGDEGTGGRGERRGEERIGKTSEVNVKAEEGWG